MERIDNIIHEHTPGSNLSGERPVLSLNGLLGLLDALQPELEAEGGLVSVFSQCLFIGLERRTGKGVGV